MSLKKEIRNLLDELADLMEFNGENKFKVSAFRNGAQIVGRLEGELEEKIKDDSIKNIKGIGKGLISVIYEYYQTGKSTEYEKLIEKIPSGILELFRIRGIGAKKIRILYDNLGIDSLEKLEKSARNNEIAKLTGFGSKTEEKILKEVERIKKSSGFLLLNHALAKAKMIKHEFESIDSAIEVIYTGQLRRKREIISVLEFLVITDNEKQFLERISNLYNYNKLTGNSSHNSYQIEMEEISKVIIHVATRENKISSLYFTTGSNDFISALNAPVNENYNAEDEIFEKAGCSYVIPEMREEEYLNISDAELKKNSNLELRAFKGFFHFHTTWSDGNNTLEEMIDEIHKAGFKYAAVCDHSKSAFYANGLTEERILLQKKEIDRLTDENSFSIYHGIESDILKNGTLDYEEDVLKQFDLIVASIHSNFNMSEEEMTSRIIKAVENPYTDLLAHPTGRLLLAREGYNVNVRKIIDACSANNVAVELNSNPHRLDIDWRYLYYAREKGCLISINPDAHSIEGVYDIHYGIMMARKAGVQNDEVLNCFSEDEFVSFINRKVKRTK